jgi:hypothetical protein
MVTSTGTVPTQKDNDDERRARIEALVAQAKTVKDPAASRPAPAPKASSRKPGSPRRVKTRKK